MLTNMFLKVAFIGAEWVMWLLLILSFVSIGIIADRVMFFWKTKDENEKLGNALPELFRTGDLKSVWEMVANSETIAGMVVAAGLQAMRKGADACSEAMQSVKLQMKGDLDARLGVLGTIGSNAPFIGLTGTVLGVIKAANDMTDTAKSNEVMAGVFEALIATAVGLFVAIPAVMAFNYFQRKVKTTLTEVDSLAHLVLGAAYSMPATKRGAGAAAAEPARAN
jgi:biopolymer transport protein ExbB/TolQ